MIQTAARYDPYCILMEGNQCGECITSYYPENGVCAPVSGLCHGYNKKNGFCIGCIPPYTLIESTGKCEYFH